MSPNGMKDGNRARTWRRALGILVVAVALASPAWSQAGRADLSRLVIVGDSLSAGYQNGSLLDRQQVHGYASLVADQARMPLALPLIGEPGIPNVLQLTSINPLVIMPAPGISPGRTDPFAQAANLAVPGQNVRDALSLRPDFPIDTLTDLVLGLPGLLTGTSRSQVEWAESLEPTTIIVWIGNNDALGAALAADTAFLTPVPDFQTRYGDLMDRLSATGATIVAANIPDVTLVPFLTPAEKVAAKIGLPLSAIGPILGIGPGDYVTPDAFPLIPPRLANPLLGPLPGNVVLTAGEVATFQSTIDAYNACIAERARAKGAALVDIHTLLLRVQAGGVVAGGQRLTTEFLGGVFSLDGIHPTDTGHAILANEFIRVLDTAFAAGIPPVSLERVAQDDPLVLPGVGRPASALGHVKPETAASLRAVMLRRQPPPVP